MADCLRKLVKSTSHRSKMAQTLCAGSKSSKSKQTTFLHTPTSPILHLLGGIQHTSRGTPSCAQQANHRITASRSPHQPHRVYRSAAAARRPAARLRPLPPPLPAREFDYAGQATQVHCDAGCERDRDAGGAVDREIAGGAV